MRNSGYTLNQILNSPLNEIKMAFDCIIASNLSESHDGRVQLRKETSKTQPRSFVDMMKAFKNNDLKND